MFDFSNTIDDTGVCALCGNLLFEGRFVRLDGGALRVFCTPGCLDATERARALRRRAAALVVARRLSVALVLLGAWLAPREEVWRRRATPVASDVLVSPAGAPAPPPLPSGWFGPEWPPTEESVLAALGRDAWVHPLAGPARRMPRTDARVFGADRPGNRAIECRNGHCGVDLGGEIWGEHVRAAHDGVVDYVQRGPNPDHGGRFVRISHHGGTVFTQYFHLAAIPRGLERGTPVRCGQVIGLLGDSGVKESQPHLHFAMSVRLAGNGYERYIDPEPLIALWPLRIPVDGSEVGLVTITEPPGMPHGSALRHARARKNAGKAPPAGESAPSESAPAQEDVETGGETQPDDSASDSSAAGSE
jgi:murein DD-endopeptidase MepM/ murein hydrolase activator NlpD